ncbi:MAG: cell division protein ZapA [Bacteroidetes bacterium]|nr:cell division protein ZapA [Bacteroidota bacterium]
MADNDISIKVNIGDRIYPLRIQAKEEEYVRKAAKLLNEKMGFFNSNFSVKDKIDGLAMAALEFTVESLNKSNENIQYQHQVQDFGPIETEISAIENILTEKP